MSVNEFFKGALCHYHGGLYYNGLTLHLLDPIWLLLVLFIVLIGWQ